MRDCTALKCTDLLGGDTGSKHDPLKKKNQLNNLVVVKVLKGSSKRLMTDEQCVVCGNDKDGDHTHFRS